MPKALFTIGFIILCLCGKSSFAEKKGPDSVQVGIYITSIHDINFRDKEYTITFWLWLKYQNKELDFMNNLEITQAKTVNKSFVTADSSNGMYILMKIQCVMKDSWKINNFPFDNQKLRLTIENSQYDVDSMVFICDTAGKHYDDKYALNGWKIDSCRITTAVSKYETAFGDPDSPTPHSEYSAYKVRIAIARSASGLFWKMFLGMYIAFLISYLCFYIHPDNYDSRFQLNVGALFAVIGNKYIVDSSLPESTTFTLVDLLHGVTLFFIMLIIAATAFSLRLVKMDKKAKARRLDMITGQIIIGVYILLNAYFIWQASKG